MSKNLFDGLSPLAAFATKLFAAANLDLAALQTAGDVNALKLALDAAKTNPDLATAINTATAKLQGDLATAATDLTTAKSSLGVAQSNIDTLTAAFAANDIALDKVAFKTGDATANAAAVKDAMKLSVAKAARVELTRHGITQIDEPAPDADPAGGAPKKKPGEGLTGAAKVRAIFAASPLLASRMAQPTGKN